jgi:anti-sigma factor ChrR (cupin superfamily)
MNPHKPPSEMSSLSSDAQDEVLPQAWVELAVQDTPTVAPSAEVKARMRTAVLARMRTTATKSSFMRINSDYGWTRLQDKVEKKILFNDGQTVTWLLRIAAGGTVVPHGHDKGVEECLVMQGSVLLNGELYTAGDYQLAHEGTRHEQVYSEQGCVVMLRSHAGRERELAMLSAYSSVTQPVSKASAALKNAARVSGDFLSRLIQRKPRQ